MRDPEYILRREEWFRNGPSYYNPFDEGEEISVYDANVVLNDTMLDGKEFPECLMFKRSSETFWRKIYNRRQTSATCWRCLFLFRLLLHISRR